MKNLFCLIVVFLYSTMALSSCTRGDDWEELEGSTIIGSDSTNIDSIISGSTETISIKIDKYMSQNSGGASVQGAAVYGDYLFQFQDKNANVYVYDLKKKSFHSAVALKREDFNHCNNVSFSRIFYDSDDYFPLLYVSGSSQGSYNHVQVYRISFINNQFGFEKIQEIVLPNATSENHLYWTGAVMDIDNNCMYIYANSYGAQIVKFAIPDYKSNYIELADNNELDRFTLPSFIHQQGAVIREDKMYVMDGVPAWGDTVILRIIDLKTKADYAKIVMSDLGFNMEPEGIDFYNDCLLCATNTNSGIYKITIQYSNDNAK